MRSEIVWTKYLCQYMYDCTCYLQLRNFSCVQKSFEMDLLLTNMLYPDHFFPRETTLFSPHFRLHRMVRTYTTNVPTRKKFLYSEFLHHCSARIQNADVVHFCVLASPDRPCCTISTKLFACPYQLVFYSEHCHRSCTISWTKNGSHRLPPRASIHAA